MAIRGQLLLRGSLVTTAVVAVDNHHHDDNYVKDTVKVELVELVSTQEPVSHHDTTVDTLCRQEEEEEEEVPWSYLAKKFPLATGSTCRRFYQAHDEKGAEQALRAYLQWRTMYGRSYPKQQHVVQQDKDAWQEAWNMTWDQVEQCQQDETGTTVLFPPGMLHLNHQDKNQHYVHQDNVASFQRTLIPQYIFVHTSNNNSKYKETATTAPKNNNNNKIILQVLPAQINVHLASAEIHALAVALYLDMVLEHADDDLAATTMSTTRADLWLDVRGAPYWANPKPMQLLPMIRTMSVRLLALHPERLHRLIIFPLPLWAVAIYNIIKTFLPRVITEQTILIPGSDKHTVPLPFAKMVPHIAVGGGGDAEAVKAHEILHEMEHVRQQAMAEAEKQQSTT